MQNDESKGVRKGSWLKKLSSLWKMQMTSICIKVPSSIEADNEMTQRFKKATKGSKGDLLGTVDIKTTKRLSVSWKLQRRL